MLRMLVDTTNLLMYAVVRPSGMGDRDGGCWS
jgi:hypothetical protein